MALKCDVCSYDNKDDALMCNLCGKIFRKEKKREPESTPAEAGRSVPTAGLPAESAPPTASAQDVTSPSAQPRPETIDGLDAAGWHERGLACLKQSQAAAALECYEKALAIEPRFTKAWGNRATILHMMGRNQEAQQCLSAALTIDPLAMTCWFTKAVIEYNAGQHGRAMQSFQEVLSYPGDLPQDSLQQARAAMQSLQANGVQPEDREALGWAAEGTLRGREGQFPRALACFEKALDLDPQLPIAWHYKSCALSKLNRFEDALVCDDKAIELDAADPELWHQKGLTLKHLRRFEEALASYDRALELEQANPGYWSDRGLVLGNLGRHEDAVASLEKAIALAPQAAAPWLNKALSEETLNRDRDAIESYQRFLEIASPVLLSHIQHAKLRVEALKAKSDVAASAAPSGGATEGGGAPPAFVAGEVTGASVSPPDNQDWFGSARVLEQAGKYEDAIDCIDQGLAAEGQRADGWYMRGCCLQQLGELEEAIASLDRSIELAPDRAEAWYHKGVSEQLSGANAEAVRSLEKFMSMASPDEHRALIEDVRYRRKKLTAGEVT